MYHRFSVVNFLVLLVAPRIAAKMSQNLKMSTGAVRLYIVCWNFTHSLKTAKTNLKFNTGICKLNV